MSWGRAQEKFERLAVNAVDPTRAAELTEAAAVLDELRTRDLTALLGQVGVHEAKGAAR
jgi:hypothetical protein